MYGVVEQIPEASQDSDSRFKKFLDFFPKQTESPIDSAAKLRQATDAPPHSYVSWQSRDVIRKPAPGNWDTGIQVNSIYVL